MVEPAQQTFIYIVPSLATLIVKPTHLTQDDRVISKLTAHETHTTIKQDSHNLLSGFPIFKPTYSLLTPFGFIPFTIDPNTQLLPQQEITLINPITAKYITAPFTLNQKILNYDTQEPIKDNHELLNINPATETTPTIPSIENQHYNCRGLQLKTAILHPTEAKPIQDQETYIIQTTAKLIYLNHIQVKYDNIKE